MEKFSYILAFIFITFLVTPSVVIFIDSDIDLSFAYNVTEEENSSKNQISFEYTFEEIESNYESIHFLQTRKMDGHYYKENVYKVFLSITSPPPKKA